MFTFYKKSFQNSLKFLDYSLMISQENLINVFFTSRSSGSDPDSPPLTSRWTAYDPGWGGGGKEGRGGLLAEGGGRGSASVKLSQCMTVRHHVISLSVNSSTQDYLQCVI